jgi:hypothetical protein
LLFVSLRLFPMNAGWNVGEKTHAPAGQCGPRLDLLSRPIGLHRKKLRLPSRGLCYDPCKHSTARRFAPSAPLKKPFTGAARGVQIFRSFSPDSTGRPWPAGVVWTTGYGL